MKELEISAKTVEEATNAALDQLGVSRDEVDIIVLKKGKSGVLGVGAEDARIKVILPESDEELTIKETALMDIARQVSCEILRAMGIVATVRSISKSSDAMRR